MKPAKPQKLNPLLKYPEGTEVEIRVKERFKRGKSVVWLVRSIEAVACGKWFALYTCVPSDKEPTPYLLFHIGTGFNAGQVKTREEGFRLAWLYAKLCDWPFRDQSDIPEPLKQKCKKILELVKAGKISAAEKMV